MNYLENNTIYNNNLKIAQHLQIISLFMYTEEY